MTNRSLSDAPSMIPAKREPLKFFLSIIAFVLPVLLAIAYLTTTAYPQDPAETFEGPNRKAPTMAAETRNSIEHRVFELINDERVKNGRSTLAWTDQAAAVARFHSTNMAEAGFFGHEDNNGRKPSNRAELLGLRDWRRIGENIAWLTGFTDPVKRVVEGWMKSEGHRNNILDSRYRESGIGLAVADGKYYFTQIFITRK